MEVNDILLQDRPYRHVFIVQNRDFWRACPYPFKKERDLVLSLDFALVNEVTAQGGTAAYLDHLVTGDVMERYNYATYKFFANWHRDKEGNDLFQYEGTEVANAFRMDIWNDITYYVRIWLNLLAIKALTYEKIFAGLEDVMTKNIMTDAGLQTETWSLTGEGDEPEYFFPIFRWMHEHIRPMRMRQRIIILLTKLLNITCRVGERLRLLRSPPVSVFVQRYYPTEEIIKYLKCDGKVTVVLESFTGSRGLVKERCIPVQKPKPFHKRAAGEMIESFLQQRHSKLEVDGIDVSAGLYAVIIQKIGHLVPESLAILDSVSRYFSNRKLGLMVSITNLGLTNCLVTNYCRKNEINTYLIINGLLGSSYLDGVREDADWINSYGESIKINLFADKEKVVCLGDPRMDYYVVRGQGSRRAGKVPTIVIGAGGFNNADLNSYVAFEFDFLNDLMLACRTLIGRGREMKLIVKVRANGYIEQYACFLNEYYPDLNVRLLDRVPMKDVLTQSDFYISIYSQTLFEASCLGVPVLYYKKDTEIAHPPFDGHSELVTALNLEDLIAKMEQFYTNDPIYDSFRDKKVMEKYVGPLDGGNLRRNVDFIYSLLNEGPAEEAGNESYPAL